MALNIHNAKQSQPSYLPFIPVARWLKEVTNDWEGTMKFRTNELTNKQMIVSIHRSPHSFRSRVIVHRTRPRVGLFKFALVVFGCNIDKMSHIAFMEVDENSDGQGLSWENQFCFVRLTCGWTRPWLAGWLCCSGEKTRKLCVIPALSPQMIFHCAGDRK